MQQGDAIPAVTVTTANDEKLALGDLTGPLVVYFYPKDDTSGCTREAQDFTALAADFAGAGVRVIGISKDSPAKHRKFTEKYTLAVELVSDEDGTACEAFGVWGRRSSTARPIWASSGRPSCSIVTASSPRVGAR
ncbi:hypothetical protein GCM10020258_03090 [Sphingomonas yabuuchiae]